MKKLLSLILAVSIVLSVFGAISLVSMAANESQTKLENGYFFADFENESDVENYFTIFSGGTVEHSATGGKDGTGALKFTGATEAKWASPALNPATTDIAMPKAGAYVLTFDLYVDTLGTYSGQTYSKFSVMYRHSSYHTFKSGVVKPATQTWGKIVIEFSVAEDQINVANNMLAFDDAGVDTFYIDNFTLECIDNSKKALELEMITPSNADPAAFVHSLNGFLTPEDFGDKDTLDVEFVYTNLTGADISMYMQYVKYNAWHDKITLVPDFNVTGENSEANKDKWTRFCSDTVKIKAGESVIITCTFFKEGYWDHDSIDNDTVNYLASAAMRITGKTYDTTATRPFVAGDKLAVAINDPELNDRFVGGAGTDSWWNGERVGQKVVDQPESMKAVLAEANATPSPVPTEAPIGLKYTFTEELNGFMFFRHEKLALNESMISGDKIEQTLTIYNTNDYALKFDVLFQEGWTTVNGGSKSVTVAPQSSETVEITLNVTDGKINGTVALSAVALRIDLLRINEVNYPVGTTFYVVPGDNARGMIEEINGVAQNNNWQGKDKDANLRGEANTTFITSIPTLATPAPTAEPTAVPTEAPTAAPTEAPTAAPTEAPTAAPTEAPTAAPTEAPTAAPTEAPTAAPTEAPTAAPTEAPTAAPTEVPTAVPTEAPTAVPTAVPTATAKPIGLKYTFTEELNGFMYFRHENLGINESMIKDGAITQTFTVYNTNDFTIVLEFFFQKEWTTIDGTYKKLTIAPQSSETAEISLTVNNGKVGNATLEELILRVDVRLGEATEYPAGTTFYVVPGENALGMLAETSGKAQNNNWQGKDKDPSLKGEADATLVSEIPGVAAPEATPTPGPTPNAVQVEYKNDASASYVVYPAGNFNSSYVKDDVFTLKFKIFNNGEEDIALRFFLQATVSVNGTNQWLGPNNGVAYNIPAGETVEIEYEFEMESNGTVLISNQQVDLSKLFVRLNYDTTPYEGVKFIVYGDKGVVDSFAGATTSAVVSYTPVVYNEPVEDKPSGSGDMLPVAMIAVVGFAAVSAIVIASKKRKED